MGLHSFLLLRTIHIWTRRITHLKNKSYHIADEKQSHFSAHTPPSSRQKRNDDGKKENENVFNNRIVSVNNNTYVERVQFAYAAQHLLLQMRCTRIRAPKSTRIKTKRLFCLCSRCFVDESFWFLYAAFGTGKIFYEKKSPANSTIQYDRLLRKKIIHSHLAATTSTTRQKSAIS